MSGFDTTLSVLLESENRDAPRLLAHVLTRGDMRLRRRAVERLLESTDGRRQALLVRHFPDLGHELESLVLQNINRLGPALRWAMASRDPAMQKTVIQLARDGQDYSLAYLAGEAVASPDEAVRGQAVDLLWRWALELRRREMSTEGPMDGLLDVEFARRRKFVLEGLQKMFGTRQAAEMPRVLTAAAMLADATAGWFWCAMGLQRDERRGALLRRLIEKLEPELLCFVVRALAHEGVASEAAELLNRVFDGKALEALLREFNRQSHLSRAALSRLREVPWLGPGEEKLTSLPANLVATALAIAAGSGMPRARLAILCREVATNHVEPAARRVAIEALAHCPDQAVAELGHVAARAPKPSAGQAVLQLARRGAAGTVSEDIMGNLLRDWWDMEANERREIARALTGVLRDHPALLRGRLAGGGDARRAAVSLLRLAQTADAFADSLRELARDGTEPRLRSAALAALADCLSQGSADVLEAALGAADPRVRANALEGLDRLGAHDTVFLRLADDPNNRVRANAAWALIERRRPEGQDVLRRMFSGGEPERVSALWVFSKSRQGNFRRTAELLAHRDPSETVRRKASELLAAS